MIPLPIHYQASFQWRHGEAIMIHPHIYNYIIYIFNYIYMHIYIMYVWLCVCGLMFPLTRNSCRALVPCPWIWSGAGRCLTTSQDCASPQSQWTEKWWIWVSENGVFLPRNQENHGKWWLINELRDAHGCPIFRPIGFEQTMKSQEYCEFDRWKRQCYN